MSRKFSNHSSLFANLRQYQSSHNSTSGIRSLAVSDTLFFKVLRTKLWNDPSNIALNPSSRDFSTSTKNPKPHVTDSQRIDLEAIRRAKTIAGFKRPEYGVSFSPAGLLTPFHLGAAEELRSLGILNPHVAVSGASGGALAAVTTALLTYPYALNKPPALLDDNSPTIPGQVPIPPSVAAFDGLDSCIRIAKHCRDSGTARGNLHSALDEMMKSILPPNAAALLNSRPAPCIITYTILALDDHHYTDDLLGTGSFLRWVMRGIFGSARGKTNPIVSAAATVASAAVAAKSAVSHAANVTVPHEIRDSNKDIDISQSEDVHLSEEDIRDGATIGWLRGQNVLRYADTEDLTSVLHASCNIPLYFAGNQICVPVRGAWAVDGVFGSHLSRCGCPHTHASRREILIAPFSAKLLRLDPYRARISDTQEIALTGLSKWKQSFFRFLNPTSVSPLPLPSKSEQKVQDAIEEVSSSSVPMVPEADEQPNCEYDVISPDLLDIKHWPFSAQQLVRLSLDAPPSNGTFFGKISDEELQETYTLLYAAGREAVRRWYETSGHRDWAPAVELSKSEL